MSPSPSTLAAERSGIGPDQRRPVHQPGAVGWGRSFSGRARQRPVGIEDLPGRPLVRLFVCQRGNNRAVAVIPLGQRNPLKLAGGRTPPLGPDQGLPASTRPSPSVTLTLCAPIAPAPRPRPRCARQPVGFCGLCTFRPFFDTFSSNKTHDGRSGYAGESITSSSSRFQHKPGRLYGVGRKDHRLFGCCFKMLP